MSVAVSLSLLKEKEKKKRSMRSRFETKCDHDWGFGSIARRRHFLHSLLFSPWPKSENRHFFTQIFFRYCTWCLACSYEKHIFLLAPLFDSSSRLAARPLTKSGVSQIFLNSQHRLNMLNTFQLSWLSHSFWCKNNNDRLLIPNKIYNITMFKAKILFYRVD